MVTRNRDLTLAWHTLNYILKKVSARSTSTFGRNYNTELCISTIDNILMFILTRNELYKKGLK